MKQLIEEIDRRLEAIFSTLANGGDLPPGLRLRTEGLLEAATLLGASPQQLQQRMNDCYRRAFGVSLSASLGEGWETFHVFPEIPAFARRAPVVPTSAD